MPLLHTADAPLRNAFEAAQTEADRLSGPPAAWNESTPAADSAPVRPAGARREILWAIVAVMLAVAAIAAVARFFDRGADAARPPSPAFATRSSAAPPPAPLDASPSPRAAAPADSVRNGISVRNGRVEFDLHQAEAAPTLARLAQLTGAVISGLDLLPAGTRLTLQGAYPQGRESWAAVLAGSNFVLSCAGGCTVFIVSGPAPGPAANGSTAVQPPQRGVAAAPAPDGDAQDVAPPAPPLVMSTPRTLDGRASSEDTAEN